MNFGKISGWNACNDALDLNAVEWKSVWWMSSKRNDSVYSDVLLRYVKCLLNFQNQLFSEWLHWWRHTKLKCLTISGDETFQCQSCFRLKFTNFAPLSICMNDFLGDNVACLVGMWIAYNLGFSSVIATWRRDVQSMRIILSTRVTGQLNVEKD